MAMSDTYEVAVLGATAAGYVAAITLAQMGHKTILVISPASPTESPLSEWLPADVLDASPVIKSVKSSMDEGFHDVAFHSEDFSQHAEYRSRTTAGYFVRMHLFLAALADKAKKAGVAHHKFAKSPRLTLQEGSVILESAGGSVEAGVLLVAQDEPDVIMSELILSLRTSPVEELTVCGLDAPLPKAGMDKALHIVTYGGHEKTGMFFASDGLVHVRIITAHPGAPASVEQLSHLIAQVQAAGLLPAKMSLAKATAAIWHPPGGVALELETHLAKRTLLVGTAGGFVSALSGQTVDPSVRSAMVAADVTHRALKSKQLQETLSEYKRHWRDELSDRIRLPGTSMKMLLPIIYANKAMAGKLARAYLYGEPI